MRPPVLAPARRIFELALGEMLWARRTVFMALAAGAPVVLAIVTRLALVNGTAVLTINGGRVDSETMFGTAISVLYLKFIVPALGVFYGTALIADEVEDKTITYLFTRPVSRRAIVFGKYLAYLVCTILLVLPSVVVVYFLIAPTGGSTIAEIFPSLLADLGMLAIGLTAYGAVFAFVGDRLKRPLVIGLVFAFGWEPAVLLFPGYLRRLTVAYYLQALVAHEMPQDSAVSMLLQVFHEVPSIFVSLTCLAVIVAATLWSAGRAVEQREYVLEQ